MSATLPTPRSRTRTTASSDVVAGDRFLPQSPRLLVALALPGGRASEFLAALSESDQVSTPRRLALAKYPSGAPVTTLLCSWQETDDDGLTELLERRGTRALVLGRSDLAAAAAIEVRLQTAVERRFGAPCAMGTSGLDWERIAELHDRAHDVRDSWHRRLDDLGVPTFDVDVEDWRSDPPAAVRSVHRWLGRQLAPGVPAARPSCRDCDNAEEELARLAAARLACDRCTRVIDLRGPGDH